MDYFTAATAEAIRQAESHHQAKVLPKINTPFGYFGSKSKISFQLSHQLPPHSCWVEAFCGSAALTLNKRRAPIEVINDIDNEIVNLFRQLRDNHDELCRMISLTPYSREELTLARVNNTTDTEIERARKFLVQAMMAVNGAFGPDRGGFSYSQSYSRDDKDARVNRWYKLPERIANVVERLRSVRIENRDAIELLSMFLKRPATLIYLDPPYLAQRSKSYTNDLHDDDYHTRLLKMAVRAKCMVLISGYDNALYAEYLTKNKGWRKRIINTQTRGIDGVSSPREEVIWENGQFQKAYTENRLLVRLTKEELKENKLNPERKG